MKYQTPTSSFMLPPARNGITPAQKAELDALAAMSDDDTDTSDMPGIREYSHPRRGMFPGSSYMRVVPGVGSVRSATTDGRKGSNE